MKIEQGIWTPTDGLDIFEDHQIHNDAQLVLYFGSTDILKDVSAYELLKARYPQAIIAGCSTGGQIIGTQISDESIVFTALYFEKTTVKAFSDNLYNLEDSFAVGKSLGDKLKGEGLAGVVVLSKGLELNGSLLVGGIREGINVGREVPISGGLAGDGDRFQETWVGFNELFDQTGVVVIGFYGQDFAMKTGACGGWDIFGPERLITKSEGNILYELDHKPALELYKRYLGEEAKNLPFSGLYFPLAIWPNNQEEKAFVARTPLDVDEKTQSITFAGDMPKGYKAQLMWGKFDSVTEGAGQAAREAFHETLHEYETFSLLVSCLGRRALLGQRTIHEVELVTKILGDNNKRLGFYSYGEIAPHANTGESVLHNETMTIATLYEK